MNKKYIKPAVSTKALNMLSILSGSITFDKPTNGLNNGELEGKQNSIFEGFSRTNEDE